MIHSTTQIAKLVERNRYNMTSLDQGEGEKPITLGFLVFEMYKTILDRDQQIEDLKKKNALASLALSKYSNDEKDEILQEFVKLAKAHLDWRNVEKLPLCLEPFFPRSKGSGDIAQGIYEGDMIGGIPNGVGEAIYKDGQKYKGEFLNGQMNGKGLLEFKDGTKYQGEFNKGKISGIGMMTYQSGDVYTGPFKEGKKHGLGFMKAADGNKQIANYRGDLNHGLCIQLTQDSKHVAIEEYQDDLKHGPWLLYNLAMVQNYDHGNPVVSV